MYILQINSKGKTYYLLYVLDSNNSTWVSRFISEELAVILIEYGIKSKCKN